MKMKKTLQGVFFSCIICQVGCTTMMREVAVTNSGNFRGEVTISNRTEAAGHTGCLYKKH